MFIHIHLCHDTGRKKYFIDSPILARRWDQLEASLDLVRNQMSLKANLLTKKPYESAGTSVTTPFPNSLGLSLDGPIF